jgi:hypothetical protein
VGPEKQRFSVCHDVLTKRSGFFEVVRSPRWSSGPHIPTDLSDHDPQEFSDYLHLVYTGEIISPDAKVSQWCDAGRSDDAFEDVCDQLHSHYEALAKMYILADKLEDLTSSNMIMDGIIEFSDRVTRVPEPKLIRYIYDHTPPNSPLRTMIRDKIIHEVQADHFENLTEADYPQQLLFDIAKEFLKLKSDRVDGGELVSDVYEKYLSERNTCHYHQHNDKHPKCELEAEEG